MSVVDVVIDIPELNTTKPGEAQLAEWEATLWDKGYLVIPNALPPATIEHFKRRLAIFGARLATRAVAARHNLRRPQFHRHIDDIIMAIDGVDDRWIFNVIGHTGRTLQQNLIGVPAVRLGARAHAMPLQGDDVQVVAQNSFHQADDRFIF